MIKPPSTGEAVDVSALAEGIKANRKDRVNCKDKSVDDLYCKGHQDHVVYQWMRGTVDAWDSEGPRILISMG